MNIFCTLLRGLGPSGYAYVRSSMQQAPWRQRAVRQPTSCTNIAETRRNVGEMTKTENRKLFRKKTHRRRCRCRILVSTRFAAGAYLQSQHTQKCYSNCAFATSLRSSTVYSAYLATEACTMCPKNDLERRLIIITIYTGNLRPKVLPQNLQHGYTCSLIFVHESSSLCL